MRNAKIQIRQCGNSIKKLTSNTSAVLNSHKRSLCPSKRQSKLP
jgi:hypothetical protein